jgi:ribonucleoside-diphosphate reductase alpha chain
MQYNIKKRSGEICQFDVSKWEKHIKKVCRGIENVSAFTIGATAQAQFHGEMTTEELDLIALRAMVNLIDTDYNPLGHINYQYVAGRQRATILRKQVFGSHKVPHILDIVKLNVQNKLYTPDLLAWYSDQEWDAINKMIDHERDMTYTFSQVEQFVDKYLVRNRATGKIVETPQVRYIIAAATAFHAEKSNRLEWINEFYNRASNGEFTLATPVASGLGTATKQFSSCVVISTDDSMDSIYASGHAMAKYAGKRAGIGFEIGRLRAVGSSIRNGEIMHTGVVPFVQKWVKDLRSVSQGGLRTGSATVNFPIWHYEFESLVVLKNNQGTEETRVRHLDYCVQLSAMFWERLLNKQDITLFSPDDVPGLYEAFHQDIAKFERLYVAAENNVLIRKKKLTAEQVMVTLLAGERSGTGRIYLYNADNVQAQSPYDPMEDTVVQTNLCTEILIPSKPFDSIISDEGLIGLCTLGSLVWGKFKNPQDMRLAVRCIYRALHNLLQYQDFLLPQSARHNEMYEPLGIGVTDLAHWHAQRGFVYGEDNALAEVKRFMEHQYFYMMEMNVELAKEKGACSRSHATRYAKGQFIFELRHPGVDVLTDFSPELDFEPLRADMIKYGVRNTTTGAIAPVESSSLLVNSTNGVSMPKTLISNKTSREGKIVQVVPELELYRENYEKLLLWSQPNPRGYLKTVAVLQAYFDQGISCDTFYNPKEYTDPNTGEVSMKIDVNDYLADLIDFQNWGGKTVYYMLVNKQRLIDRLKTTSTIVSPVQTENTDVDEDYCESCVL